MPGLPARKGQAISLVQDQDISLVGDDEFDLTITVIGAPEEDGVKHVTDVLVSFEICNKSPYMKALLEESKDKSELTFGGTRIPRMMAKTRKLGLFEISILGVWHTILLWSTHQDDKVKETLGAWFESWYNTCMASVVLDIHMARVLAYPCHVFDNAVGYARVTKYLAYEHVGHVKERLPKGFKGPKHLHINERMFVGPLNHARGGLRNTLHKSLYSRVGRILRSETSMCSCWDATIGRYQYALSKCGAWPVDDVLNYSSIAQVVRRLKGFSYNYTPKCNKCRGIDWETIVLKAQSNTLGYFNGMCLDCMDRSNPRSDSLDDDYEKHNQAVGDRWDTQCRIKHCQPTWYISWLGRPDIREKILRGPDGYRAPEEE